VLGGGLAGPHRVDITKKRDAVQDELEPLVEDVFRAGKDRLEGLVGEQDAVLGVDEEDALLQAAESGFELADLAGARLLKLPGLGDEFVGRRTQSTPTIRRFGGGLEVAVERLPFPDGLIELAEHLPVLIKPPQGEDEAEGQYRNDQSGHASALRSAIR